ncbi:MlaD family protein [Mycolicibacterium austroafricanum]|uniref:MlaD family protein n=1 Tax=Mycolicibacterium austroafricanum TaxID=39687 RepID=UPI001CA383B7|nr:MlaD family protein [Mycolicibacterium austroafricanum]QZT58553.1 MlaD family protein [Mycolicibacterium austroafricanum]
MRKSVQTPVFWGATTLAFVTVIALVVGWIYLNPPKQQIVTFYTDDVASVHAGDTVRIAGIVVGKVKDLSIEPDQVRVRASVDGDAFVGDQSQIEVRMLTVVGGYYVTINSLGDRPLGARPIPRDRVTMPYSLIQTLTDSTKITDNVATKPISESIQQIEEGLTGTNTDSLAQLINTGNTITQMMERQRGQLSTILEFSNEYVDQLNQNRELLVYVVSRVAILEQSLVLYGKGFAAAMYGIGQITKRLEPVNQLYMPHRQDFLDRVRGVLGEFQTIADRNGALVRVLRRVRDRMEATLAAQNQGTPPELFATDLCIPTEGSRC